MFSHWEKERAALHRVNQKHSWTGCQGCVDDPGVEATDLPFPLQRHMRVSNARKPVGERLARLPHVIIGMDTWGSVFHNATSLEYFEIVTWKTKTKVR
jgi:hypothetical protein